MNQPKQSAPETSGTLDFQVGDKVAHPAHGTGVVRRRVSVTWNGMTQDVYVIEFPVMRSELYVPISEAGHGGLRLAAAADELNDLAALLAAPPGPLPPDRLARRAVLERRLPTPSVRRLAELVRDLTAFLWVKARAYSWKDCETLDQARRLLAAEWALAAGISFDAAGAQIDQALRQGS